MCSLCTKNFLLAAVAGLFVVLYACAPQRPYRAPLPPSGTTSLPRTPQTTAPVPPPPAPPPEANLRPVPEEGKIREQDIGTKMPTTPPAAKESKESSRQGSLGESRTSPESPVFQSTAPPLPDDSSLLGKITPGVTPQRAASLRLTDEGRNLLDAGDSAKALARLERTIAIDSTNPYGYFYLAKAQHRLGRHRESLNFLDVAESRLSGDPFWLAEVYALRGENYRALGLSQRAETSYVQSLRLNSGNRTAADALLRMQADAQAPTK